MKEIKLNLDKLEDAGFQIEKEAFKPEALTCSECNAKMKKEEIGISLDSGVSISLSGFECPQCKKRYLGLEESKKLDKALIAVATIGSVPFICLAVRPDLFMKVATNPIFTELVKYLILIFGN